MKLFIYIPVEWKGWDSFTNAYKCIHTHPIFIVYRDKISPHIAVWGV